LRRDRQELTQADSHSNPRGAESSIPSVVIKGSRPMSAVERFHQCPEFTSFLVSDSELAAIVHAVTDCLEDTLQRLCSDAKVIGIAIDGSTDRSGLRHTGMSARWCDTQTATTGDLSWPFKRVRAIRDSGIGSLISTEGHEHMHGLLSDEREGISVPLFGHLSLFVQSPVIFHGEVLQEFVMSQTRAWRKVTPSRRDDRH
jgi:hypothetical protein